MQKSLPRHRRFLDVVRHGALTGLAFLLFLGDQANMAVLGGHVHMNAQPRSGSSAEEEHQEGRDDTSIAKVASRPQRHTPPHHTICRGPVSAPNYSVPFSSATLASRAFRETEHGKRNGIGGPLRC